MLLSPTGPGNGREKKDFIKGGRGGGSPFYEVISKKSFFTHDPFPKVLQCKINHKYFSQTWGSQTGGRGGLRLGKNSHIFLFFFVAEVPK